MMLQATKTTLGFFLMGSIPNLYPPKALSTFLNMIPNYVSRCFHEDLPVYKISCWNPEKVGLVPVHPFFMTHKLEGDYGSHEWLNRNTGHA